MTQANLDRLARGFGKTLNVVEPTVASTEDNDVNININAETEGGEDNTPAVVEAPVVDADAIPLDTSESPEASELEAQEVQNEADETDAEVNEIDNTLDSLESIYFTLAHASVEGAEITPAFARMTHTAVQNAVGNFGLTSEDCGVASVEAIALAPEAEMTASMEGVAETVKTAVAQLGSHMDRVVKSVDSFAQTYGTAAGRANKRISDVESRLNSFEGTPKTDVTIPAVLNGNIKAADLNSIAAAGKAYSTAKYADLAVLAKSDSLTADAVKAAFAKASAAVTKGDKEVLPGYKFTPNEDGVAVLTKVETASKEVTLSPAEAKGALAAAKNLTSVASDYSNVKSSRKQVSDTIKSAIKTSSSEEGAKLMARLAGRRKLAKAWSRQVSEEGRVVGLMVTYANAVSGVVASTVKGAKKAEAAE